MKPLRASLLFTAAMALLSSNPAVQASPDTPGTCSQRLMQLGYSQPELKDPSTTSSLYEAYRGRDEVKLLLDNKTCRIQKTWLDN